MSNKVKKVLGLWLDHNHAFVIGTESRTSEGDFTIISKIESEVHKNGKGKNDINSLARETEDLKKYFKEISHILEDAEEIFIFGPGKAQEELKNFLSEKQQFNDKIIELGTSDKISENQMIAKVKTHF